MPPPMFSVSNRKLLLGFFTVMYLKEFACDLSNGICELAVDKMCESSISVDNYQSVCYLKDYNCYNNNLVMNLGNMWI